jgi:hypothetical protein
MIEFINLNAEKAKIEIQELELNEFGSSQYHKKFKKFSKFKGKDLDIKNLKVGDTVVHDNQEIERHIVEKYKEFLQHDPNKHFPWTTPHIYIEPPAFFKILERMSAKCASGFDLIPSEVLDPKLFNQVKAREYLYHLFHQIFSGRFYTADIRKFFEARFVGLNKVPDGIPTVEDIRPICMPGLIQKIFEIYIYDDLYN